MGVPIKKLLEQDEKRMVLSKVKTSELVAELETREA